MKKLKLIIALLLLSFISNAQTIWDRNHSLSFDATFGVYDDITKIGNADYGRFAMTFSMTIYGFYFDFGVSPYKKSQDIISVQSIKTPAIKNYSLHAGFQFPICEFIKVIPYCGCYWYHEGYYDSSICRVSDQNLYSTFINTYSMRAVDYGGILRFTIGKMLNINIQAGRYALMGGIGLSLPFN